MIISEAELKKVITAYRAEETRVGEQAEQASSAVAFEELAHARTLYEVLPPYRFRRVNELRRRIYEGRYFVPSDRIVEKILGRLMVDAIAV